MEDVRGGSRDSAGGLPVVSAFMPMAAARRPVLALRPVLSPDIENMLTPVVRPLPAIPPWGLKA